MCPVLPTYRYQKIATNSSLPQSVRDGAQAKMDRDKAFHGVLRHVPDSSRSTAPTSANDNFHCSIYSMGSSWPDKSKKYDGDDAPDLGPNVAKHPLPGLLVKDSKGFVVADERHVQIEDSARDKCFDGFRATYDLYKKIFGRESLDDKGKELVASIHIGIGYDNAYWSVDQMFFGDGGSGRGITMPGARIPDDLTAQYCCYDLDTIGHELTHGVVQNTADLGEDVVAGTLNESIADCFGEMVRQYVKNLTVWETDWNISTGWWAKSTTEACGWSKNYCRTFRKANPDDHEAAFESKHMSEWIDTTDPHPNCGIPNHAFYLAALEFGGYAYNTVGKIWYGALTDPEFKKASNQTFRGFADLTCRHARKLFASKAEAIVKQAWTKVGVYEIKDWALPPTAPAKTTDQLSREKCSTGQYHSVVAISEDLINAQLESYFNMDAAFRTMDVQNKFLKTGIKADLAPSRVEIPWKSQSLDASSVIYHLRIKKADISYTDIPSSLFNPYEDELIQAKIKDWDFAFHVNLDMEEVQKADRADVKKMLRVAGDYSIQRLLLNFGMSNTTNFITSLSDLKMADGSQPPQELCVSLGEWVKQWTVSYNQIENRLQGKQSFVTGGRTVVREANCPILYHALAPDPSKANGPAPMIPPVDVIQQTYVFERPGKMHIDSTNRNSILYTEMCIKKGLPSPILFDPSNGNYITDDMPWRIDDELSLRDSNVLGSMCLSSRILFKEHFVPRLKPLVKMTHVTLDKCWTSVRANNEYQWNLSFSGNPDKPDCNDEYYTMQPMPGNDTIYTQRTWFGGTGDNVPEAENQWGYRFVMADMAKLKDASESTLKDSSIELHARSICQLIPQKGTNRVRLSGATTVAVYVGNKRFLREKETKGFATTGFWRMDFVIKTSNGALKDGQLDIDVEYNDPLVRFTNWGGGSTSDFNGDDALTQMQAKLNSNIEKLKEYVEGTVKDTLKQSQFVLAGAGAFIMHNPIFTEKGDLLVELEYKKVPIGGKPEDFTRPQMGVVGGTSLSPPSFVNDPAKPVTSSISVKG